MGSLREAKPLFFNLLSHQSLKGVELVRKLDKMLEEVIKRVG
jgi:hypothetical protein